MGAQRPRSVCLSGHTRTAPSRLCADGTVVALGFVVALDTVVVDIVVGVDLGVDVVGIVVVVLGIVVVVGIVVVALGIVVLAVVVPVDLAYSRHHTLRTLQSRTSQAGPWDRRWRECGWQRTSHLQYSHDLVHLDPGQLVGSVQWVHWRLQSL